MGVCMEICITKGCWNWTPYSSGLCNKCEEEKSMGVCMDCKKSKCDCMQNHWDLINKDKEKGRSKMLTCDDCGVDLTYDVRYKGTYKCKECSPVFEMNKQDYFNVIEEKNNNQDRLERIVESKDITNNQLRNKVKELERHLKEMTSIANGRGEELNKVKKDRDIWLNQCRRYYRDIESLKWQSNELGRLTKFISEEKSKYGKAGMITVSSVIEIINELEKEIEDVKEQLETMTNLYDKRKQRVEELENQLTVNRGVGEMKNNITEVKCCQVCAKFNWRQYLLYKNIEEKNTIERHALSEDCEICKWKEESVKSKTKFGKLIENTSYGFEDSWMLSYKVEGMKEPIIQHNLTKEECEIIYGNMNDITYWFMEVMGK